MPYTIRENYIRREKKSIKNLRISKKNSIFAQNFKMDFIKN